MSNYHHGNLRNALIVAAAELIEESGSSDFSMIEASRRAGVSNAAPYRHFRDKEALIEAVCQLAFMGLTQATEAAGASYTKGTPEHIIALGLAYIKFVKAHPHFYVLMWGNSGSNSMSDSPLALTAAGFYSLVESVQMCCNNRGVKDKEAGLGLSAKLWGLVHGLGSLSLNQHLEKLVPGADIAILLESGAQSLLNDISR